MINKINIDGVDHEIVSESAERKIAELEKNNTALASVTFGTRNDQEDPVTVKFGGLPVNFGSDTDIYIGQNAYLGEGVEIGTKYPVSIGWEDDGSLTIRSNGSNRGAITIGSNVKLTVGSASGGSSSNSDIDLIGTGTIQLDHDTLYFGTADTSFELMGKVGAGIQISMYNEETLHIAQNTIGFSLKISSNAIEYNGNNLLGTGVGGGNSSSVGDLLVESHDGTELHLGTDSCSVVAKSQTGIDLKIGTPVRIGNKVNIGEHVAIGSIYNSSPDYYIQIGTDLYQGDRLHLRGPIYLAAEQGETSLTIGTDGEGYLNIDWGESDKIVFTNLKSGKKATLTLS